MWPPSPCSRSLASTRLPPGSDVLDAWGRRRSSRSTPTGRGSRGGTAFGAQYWRDYRRDHPEYRSRERRRRRIARQVRADLYADRVPTFTQALRVMAQVEVDKVGMRELARRMMVGNSTLHRFLRDEKADPRMDLVDAFVVYFGIYRITYDFRRQVRLAGSGYLPDPHRSIRPLPYRGTP